MLTHAHQVNSNAVKVTTSTIIYNRSLTPKFCMRRIVMQVYSVIYTVMYTQNGVPRTQRKDAVPSHRYES